MHATATSFPFVQFTLFLFSFYIPPTYSFFFSFPFPFPFPPFPQLWCVDLWFYRCPGIVSPVYISPLCIWLVVSQFITVSFSFIYIWACSYLVLLLYLSVGFFGEVFFFQCVVCEWCCLFFFFTNKIHYFVSSWPISHGIMQAFEIRMTPPFFFLFIVTHHYSVI